MSIDLALIIFLFFLVLCGCSDAVPLSGDEIRLRAAGCVSAGLRPVEIQDATGRVYDVGCHIQDRK